MATATKSPSPSPSPQAQDRTRRSLGNRLLGLVDGIYRFLASLKLAVISLSALAASLAYATSFESNHGTTAAQDYIYKSAWFSMLLAFLGINILCAALIRFPWKKRQTGFVITHAGLLVLIFGSYVHFRAGDEGLVGMLEGEKREEMVRTGDPVFRVAEVDPHTGQPVRETELPFESCPFPWGPTQPRLANAFDLLINTLTGGRLPSARAYHEELTKPGDPFKFIVKQYLPSATPAVLHVADPAGDPMARIRLRFKAPGMPEVREGFPTEEDQWFKLERKFYRKARSDAPALVAFAYVDRPELVEDFLKPPMDGGPRGVARFRYPDKAGKLRTFDLPLDGFEEKPSQDGQPEKKRTLSLPDSDLTVVVEKVAEFPTGGQAGLSRLLGESDIPVGMFKIAKGGGPGVDHFAMASLPMVPNVMPRTDPHDTQGAPAQSPTPLASIHMMVPPRLDPKSNGRFGQIEVLAGPDRSLYYRVFGRGKEGKTELRSSGPVEKGRSIAAFGGGANMPMTISFQVEDYLPAGVEKPIFEPLFLPKGQMENAIPAALVEFTVGGKTEEFWVQRSESLDKPVFKPVTVGSNQYEVAFDSDRRPLGFELKLDDFDVGFEPGTESATRFVSKVRLSDPSVGIKDSAHTISMNEPMSHRGYTFYQMRYSPLTDPRTGQRTGQFQSVFQVGSNPGRPIIYGGCLLLVAGIFVQFYMRAGVFTDGGKRERERQARKEGRTLPPEPAKPGSPAVEENIL